VSRAIAVEAELHASGVSSCVGGRSLFLAGITLSVFMHCSAVTRVKRVLRRERLRVLNQAERCCVVLSLCLASRWWKMGRMCAECQPAGQRLSAGDSSWALWAKNLTSPYHQWFSSKFHLRSTSKGREICKGNAKPASQRIKGYLGS
jgi:hypothetical protein